MHIMQGLKYCTDVFPLIKMIEFILSSYFENILVYRA